MITSIADITDNDFQKLSEEDKTLYLDRGTANFIGICQATGVDHTLIPDPLPYLPAMLINTFSVIAYCQDNFGSNFRDIREGVTIDVYKQKYDALTAICSGYIGQLTNGSCGIVTDPASTATSFTTTLGRG